MKKIVILAMCFTLFSCSNKWTAHESEIINSDLRIYNIANYADSLVLRAQSVDISDKDLMSPECEALVNKMMTIVQTPPNDGVGIAAPQIGINRNLVIVQRFDKESEPFEAYPNLRITHYSDSTQVGPEGCLSIDDIYGDITRSASIKVSYFDLKSKKRVEEEISGFTAVIFQHEFDHLNGVLFIDHLESTSSSVVSK